MPSNLVPGYPATVSQRQPTTGQGSGGAYESVPASVAGFATGTVTIGGTPTSTNVVTTTINGRAVAYTLVGGDTTATLTATHVAAAINADGTASGYVTATAVGAVVTLTSKTAAAAGQFSLVAAATGATTATASNTLLELAGGLYAVLTTFTWTFKNGAQTFYKGLIYSIARADALLMRTAGYVK